MVQQLLLLILFVLRNHHLQTVKFSYDDPLLVIDFKMNNKSFFNFFLYVKLNHHIIYVMSTLEQTILKHFYDDGELSISIITIIIMISLC